MSIDPSCIFCRIAEGEAPAARIYEDDDAIAFLDLFPATDGHTLVIPKVHYENLFDATDGSLPAVWLAARRVAHAMRKALAPDGLMVFQLNGAAAGQTVFHYHIHLVPRAAGSELRLHGREKADAAKLDALAARIAAAVAPRR
ncbi:MAG TPA: HIT family protein [Myxococcota bacterium]|nr:HIT family protein [Myxococcota bacterium]